MLSPSNFLIAPFWSSNLRHSIESTTQHIAIGGSKLISGSLINFLSNFSLRKSSDSKG